MVVPLVGPVLLGMGVDPVWLGVMMAINLQTSFLTPLSVCAFYLRGAAPESVTGDIYRGAFRYYQLIMLALLAWIPEMATWLPEVYSENDMLAHSKLCADHGRHCRGDCAGRAL